MLQRVLCLLFLFSGLQLKAEKKEVPDSLPFFLKMDLPDSLKSRKIFNYGYHKLSEINYTLAKKYGNTALKLALKSGSKYDIAQAHLLIGYCYNNLQRYSEAIEEYYQGIRIADELHHDQLKIDLYNCIGISYSMKKQSNKAIPFFIKATEIGRKQKNDFALGVLYNNIAIEYRNLKQFDRAKSYLKLSQKHLGGAGYNGSNYNFYINYGAVFFDQKQYDSCLIFYRKALAETYKPEFSDTRMTVFGNLAELFLEIGKVDSSVYYSKELLKLVNPEIDKLELSVGYRNLSKALYKKGDYRQAFDYYEKYNAVTDSLYSQEALKKTQDAESAYNMLKNEKRIEVLEKNAEINALEKKKTTLEKKRRDLFTTGLIVLSLLLLITLYFIFKRLREKKKANELLQLQKTEIETQKKEITDSINYAQRIQSALLTPEEEIQKISKDYFLIYKPKDIVSGDFYWFETKGNTSWFAVVDCTGHGVPGGFMSIMGHNALYRCIHDFGLRKPSDILDKLSEIIATSFNRQEQQTIRDGMDIALCSLTRQNGSIVLEFAGANNPLWVYNENGLTEIKGDKQGVGYNEEKQQFTSHSIRINKGDIVYLFSDGYADQFGGEAGKKFKYSKMKEIIAGHASREMHQQKQVLEQAFDEWKGDFEQLDDVCLIGLKLE